MFEMPMRTKPMVVQQPSSDELGAEFWRELADRPCIHCGKSVGYDVPFRFRGNLSKEVEHESCREAEIAEIRRNNARWAKWYQQLKRRHCQRMEQEEAAAARLAAKPAA